MSSPCICPSPATGIVPARLYRQSCHAYAIEAVVDDVSMGSDIPRESDTFGPVSVVARW